MFARHLVPALLLAGAFGCSAKSQSGSDARTGNDGAEIGAGAGGAGGTGSGGASYVTPSGGSTGRGGATSGTSASGGAGGGMDAAAGGASGSGGVALAASGGTTGLDAPDGAGGNAPEVGPGAGGRAGSGGGGADSPIADGATAMATEAGGRDSITTDGGGVDAASGGCNFTVDYAQSTAIGTVTIVNWSVDLPNLTLAHIDFGPAGADFTMTAPVALAPAGQRTLLLGMKAAHAYVFRIVASAGTVTCTSATFPITTGPLPAGPPVTTPVITKTTALSGGAQGFYLTAPGIQQGPARGLPGAYIFDTDGDVVWWTPQSVEGICAAHLSWDGQTMWYVTGNNGSLYKTAMDGLATATLASAKAASHELAALPGGGVAALALVQNQPALVEVRDDDTASTIVLCKDVYQPSNGQWHPNAVAYHESDDTFTISDLDLDGIVKIRRTGELVWQLGGANPKGASFTLSGITQWDGNHGHDLGPQGQILFFNNFADNSGSRVVELLLDESKWTATKTWDYAMTARTQYLGGVQRLPNGNTSIVRSMAGTIDEVNQAGALVQRFDNSYSFAHNDLQSVALFGYAEFRTTLYGPPTSTWPK